MKGLIFTYVTAYGGALVSLFDPYVGLLIYVCFALIKPEAMWFWAVPPGNYSRVVALGLLVGWALQGFGRWNFGRARAVVIMMVSYWLWGVLGMLLAPDPARAMVFVEGVFKIILPVLVGITMIDSMAKLKALAWVILLSQGYLAFELNLSYYAGTNRVDSFAGLDNNSMAISLVTTVGLAFFLGLHARAWWQKGLAFLAAAFMAHAVIFSFSRGGILSLIITGMTAFVLLPKKQPAHYLALALAVLLALRMAGPEVRERFFTTFADQTERDFAAQSRLDLWRDCADAMARRPLLGFGPDHWPLIAKEYGWPEGKEAHSLWMQTGAEMGVPGLAFLALFYGLCMRRLWPLTRDTTDVPDPWMRYLARMVLASLAGFVVSAQFVSLERLETPFYVCLLGAGVLKLYSLQTAAAPAAAPATEPGAEPEPELLASPLPSN
jgi:probable O-glycosylation ligase (exosortase A-associated)